MAKVYIDGPVQPSEDYRFGVDFVRRIPTGTTLQSVDTVTVADQAGVDVTATILMAGTKQVDASLTSASARFHNFTDGKDYTATFFVTLSDGQTREGDLGIPCRET